MPHDKFELPARQRLRAVLALLTDETLPSLLPPESELTDELLSILSAADGNAADIPWREICDRIDAFAELAGFKTSLDQRLEAFERDKANITIFPPVKNLSDSKSRPASYKESILAAIRRSLTGEPLRQPSLEPLATCPKVEHPAEVSLGARFFVDVQIALGAQESSDPVLIERSSHGQAEVEIQLGIDPQEGLIATTNDRGLLVLGESTPSALLRFGLWAKSSGSHRIDVRLRIQGQERAVLSSEVHVAQASSRELETISLSRSVAPPTTGACAPLVLTITDKPSGCRVSLRDTASHHPVFPEGDIHLKRPLREFLVDVGHLLNVEEKLSSSDAREQRLRSLGANIAKQVLPFSIREALEAKPKGQPLHIECEDAWIPWELLWLENLQSFLGDHFAVTRWLRRGIARDRIHAKEATLVAPDDSNLDLRLEKKGLRELFPNVVNLRHFEEVVARLTTGPSLGFLHFACHGRAEESHPLGSSLTLQNGNRLRPLDLPPPMAGELPPIAGSLVFLNTCQSALPGERLTGHGSWARTFLRHGASAVIAASWAIENDAAAHFAYSLKSRIGEGQPIAKALLDCRRLIYKRGDSSRLAYTLYSTPQAHLSVSDPA